MYVAVADEGGHVEKFFDLAGMLDVEGRRHEIGIRGFNVDRNGSVLFTVQPLFTVGILSLDGSLRTFGTPGGAPGRFNVVAGVASDQQGNIYVADLLKSVVQVFDENLRFVREFGYRGNRLGSLVAPVDLVYGHGRLFVSQYARRGVSVFKVEPSPPG